MKLSHTLGITAGAALLAASGLASAAVVNYSTNGYVVTATGTPIGGGATACDAFGIPVGSKSTSTIFYPGQGVAGMVLVSPGTKPSGKTGSTSTTVCTSPNTADLTGASTMNFNCYVNTQNQTAIPTTAAATIAATFKGAATSVNAGTATAGAAINVETSSTLVVGALSCSFVTDATWIAQ